MTRKADFDRDGRAKNQIEKEAHVEEEGGWYVAYDEETGAAGKGRTEDAAIDDLVETVHYQESHRTGYDDLTV